jgi:cation:H+ antiporter
MLWLEFLILAVAIGFGGLWLSRFGDIIAERTGLSGSWVGLIMLSTVTSLPELVTGVSAVTVAHAPNIAVGDALGSCVFNLLIVAAVDLTYRRAPLFSEASLGHVLSANFGTFLLGLVGLNLLVGQGDHGPAIGRVGLLTPVIFGVYLLALRMVFAYERRQVVEPTGAGFVRYPGVTLPRALLGYAASAAVVFGAGLWLPVVGVQLARSMGWTNTFVGTLFMSAATSLPELVVTIGAVRLGALDMAIANLLGSNLFNMVVLAVDDLAYAKGPLLAHASRVHAATVFSALIMNGVVSIALMARTRARPLRLVSWASLGLVAIYALNAGAIYLAGE